MPRIMAWNTAALQASQDYLCLCCVIGGHWDAIHNRIIVLIVLIDIWEENICTSRLLDLISPIFLKKKTNLGIWESRETCGNELFLKGLY